MRCQQIWSHQKVLDYLFRFTKNKPIRMVSCFIFIFLYLNRSTYAFRLVFFFSFVLFEYVFEYEITFHFVVTSLWMPWKSLNLFLIFFFSFGPIHRLQHGFKHQTTDDYLSELMSNRQCLVLFQRNSLFLAISPSATFTFLTILCRKLANSTKLLKVWKNFFQSAVCCQFSLFIS